MNIKSTLAEATLALKQAKIKNPHLEAEILLSNTLKKPREFILAHLETQLSKSQINNFKFKITQRSKGEPIAYITGHKEFYSLDFHVNKNVIIPRPETELMVEEALKIIKEKTIIIDVGTGCGCIIIALAKILNQKSKIPGRAPQSGAGKNQKFLATDISNPALTIARKNAKSHKVDKNITFLSGYLLEPIIYRLKILNLKPKIVIMANLPYLTSTQIKYSPTIQYEPKIALSAGTNGLKYYRQLFKQVKYIIQIFNNASSITIFCEIDPSQTIKIKQLAKNILPQCKYKIKKDLKGHNRLFIIEINNQ